MNTLYMVCLVYNYCLGLNLIFKTIVFVAIPAKLQQTCF